MKWRCVTSTSSSCVWAAWWLVADCVMAVCLQMALGSTSVRVGSTIFGARTCKTWVPSVAESTVSDGDVEEK